MSSPTPNNSGLDPTTPLEAYLNTTATGGDSLYDNLNVFYNVSAAPAPTLCDW